jgi:transcription antitermination protein NusB
MAARSKARKRALDVLFEAEVRGAPVLDLLAERITLGDPPVSEYAADLVRGVTANRERIDSLIAEHAEGWTLDRMPAVDRNVLRIGVYELLSSDEVPDAVAMSEAVALAQDLSTDASPAFVNGILARLADLKPPLIPEDPSSPPFAPPVPSAASVPAPVPSVPASVPSVAPVPSADGSGPSPDADPS